MSSMVLKQENGVREFVAWLEASWQTDPEPLAEGTARLAAVANDASVVGSCRDITAPHAAYWCIHCKRVHEAEL